MIFKSLAVFLFLLGSVLAVTYIDSCTNITVASVYELNTSISGNQSTGKCIDIQVGNVVLNCAGFSLTGENLTGSKGIASSTAVSNVTIKNCNIKWYHNNIYTYYGSDYTIYNNSLREAYEGTYGTSIYVYKTNNVNISNNVFHDDEYRNSYIYYSNNSVLFNNSMYDSAGTTEYGITLAACYNTTVQDNYFENHRYTSISISISGSVLTIKGNVINKTRIYQGINVRYASFYNIFNNTIIDAGGFAGYSDSGAVIPGSNGVVENNTIKWVNAVYKKKGIRIILRELRFL